MVLQMPTRLGPDIDLAAGAIPPLPHVMGLTQTLCKVRLPAIHTIQAIGAGLRTIGPADLRGDVVIFDV